MFKSKGKKGDEAIGDVKKKKMWGRKKSEPEPVPQVDVAVALPSTENFRTSLLMPNLSARFSMLREQDDPSSILGKASDDSVLHARNKSRLGGFGDTGLSDIAEVASIHSVRPPFASTGRSASYHTDNSIIADDDSSYSGSIMARSRPGEGNVLFGGRQKIYKIPVGDAGSVKNLGSNEPRGMKGRALYEDDVHMSAFQKYREQERQAERERRLLELEREMQSDEMAITAINSPVLSTYDEKRETTSSTNSGPSRTSGSTAATSIMSHGPTPGSAAQSPGATTPQSAGPPSLQRSNSRRLYDSNLDHHMSEQQSAALNRINSIQRKASSSGRSTPQYLTQSRSATNLRERFGPPVSTESSRAASPLPPTGDKLTTFESVRSPTSDSPKSPNFGDTENPLTQAVERADRGKATALGQFNRPRRFDEQQFLQRQRSLHQQRGETRSPRYPTSRPSNEQRRPSGEDKPFFPPRRPSEETRMRNGSIPNEQRPAFIPRPRAPTGQSSRPRPSLETRSRSGTDRSDSARPSMGARFRSESQSGASSPVPARSLQSSTQSPASGSPTKAGQREFSNSSSQAQPGELQSSMTDQERTVYSDSPVSPKTVNDESPLLGREREDSIDSPKISLERGRVEDVPAPLRSPPHLRDHPAMRPEPPVSPTKEAKRVASHPNLSIDELVPSPQEEASVSLVNPGENNAEEDLLSPAGNHLKGLIRTHLRQLSNASSVYPMDDDKSQASEKFDEGQRLSHAVDSNINLYTSDDHFNPHNIGVAMSSPSQIQGPAHLSQGPRAADLWMNELSKQHTRDASTETQHERQAFTEDLRLRQKAIQENLRIKAESGQRSPSPGNVAAKQHVFENGMKPFGLLRKVSSRDDMSKKKMGLGISSASSIPNTGVRPTPQGQFRTGREPPVGRTLHMRMQDTQPISANDRSRSASRPRKTSLASEQNSVVYRTPPDSSRTSTSTSTDGNYRRDAPDSTEIRRSDFPSGLNSTHPSARPSFETTRQRSDSCVNTRATPAVPPLRTNIMGNARPPMASLGTSTNSLPSTTSVSPIHSTNITPPLSSTSLSSPDLRGQTNTSLSQTPLAGTSPVVPATLPPNTFTFPPRAEKDRPAARRTGRSLTINKGNISQPTLISSTSNFETMELDEKRAQLQAMSIGNSNAQSSNTSSTAMSPPPVVSPMSPSRRMPFTKSPTDSGRASPAMETANTEPSVSGNAFKRSNEREQDDFVTRPHGGRLRIRKVSSESGGLNTRRHEAVRDSPAEGQGPDIAGGMI